jgi:hypothetical protein
MRNFVLATATSLALAGAANAGGMAAPVMEPEAVKKEAAAPSSGGIIIPLILLVIVAVAIAGSGGSGPVT